MFLDIVMPLRHLTVCLEVWLGGKDVPQDLKTGLLSARGAVHHRPQQKLHPRGRREVHPTSRRERNEAERREALEAALVLGRLGLGRALVADDAHVDRTKGARVVAHVGEGALKASSDALELHGTVRHAAEVERVAVGPVGDPAVVPRAVQCAVEVKPKLVRFRDQTNVRPLVEL